MQLSRLALAGLTAAAVLLGTAPTRANDASNRAAYDAVVKCVVAIGEAKLDERDAGRPTRAAEYETKTRRSYDLAFKIGAKLGLSGDQVQHDLDGAIDTELPRMMHNRSYYLDVVSTCKAIGLM